MTTSVSRLAPGAPTVAATRDVAAACWLPPGLRKAIDAMPGGSTPYRKRYDHDDEHREVVFERLSPEAFGRVIAFLRQRRREVLARRSVREIIGVNNASPVDEISCPSAALSKRSWNMTVPVPPASTLHTVRPSVPAYVSGV